MAAPLGPAGILCLRRTSLEGYVPGLFSGLGVATSDGIYSFIAGFGLTSVFNLLILYQFWLRLSGGIVLCFLGIYTLYHTSLVKISSSPNKTTLPGAYISALILSLMNPGVIISYATLFAVTGLICKGISSTCSLTIAAFVFAGSACWWVILNGTVSMLSLNLNQRLTERINQISGMLFVGFGLFMFGSIFFY